MLLSIITYSQHITGLKIEYKDVPLTNYYLYSSMNDINDETYTKRRVLMWVMGNRNMVGSCPGQWTGPFRYIIEDVPDTELVIMALKGISVIKLEFNPYSEIVPLCMYDDDVIIFPNISRDIVMQSCTHLNWQWEMIL